MGKILLNELAALLADKLNISQRQAQRFVSSMVTVITEGLQTDRVVKVKGLGTFKVIDVEARESVNVNTGERLVIDGHSRLTFLPDSIMKDVVNRPFAHFETVLLNDGVEFDDVEETQTEELPSEQVDNSPEPLLAELPGEESLSDEPADEAPETAEADSTAEQPPLEFVDDDDPVEEPIAEAPAEEVPFAEEPSEEEPSQDEPSEEEPSVDEPSEEEPSVEEPSEEESSEEESSEEESSEEESSEEESSEEDLLDEEPSEEESSDEELLENIADEDLAAPRRRSWLPMLIACLLTLAVGFGAGYFFGQQQGSRQTAATPVAAKEKPVASTDESSTAVSEETTAATEEATAVEDAAAEQGESVANQADVVKEETPAVATDSLPLWEYYNNMSARTRDGAYYIMGLDRVVEAREGDNTRRLARRYFGGDDMSCYIEVFNGIESSTVLVAGTKVKIPKIETKKSVRNKQNKQKQSTTE